MKRLVVPSLILLLLVGCSRQSGEQSAGQQADTAPVSKTFGTGPVKVTWSNQANAPLPCWAHLRVAFSEMVITGRTASAWTLAVIHWFVVAVLLSREVYVTILRHRAEAHGVNFAATASGTLRNSEEN